MFDSYLIELDDLDAGILLRQGEAFVFHAVAPRFRAFEGAVFPDPWSAERALRRQSGRASRRRDAPLGATPRRDPPPPVNRGRHAG